VNIFLLLRFNNIITVVTKFARGSMQRSSKQDVVGPGWSAARAATGHLERVGTEQVAGRSGGAQQAERVVSELLVMRRRRVVVMVVIVIVCTATAAVHLVSRRIVSRRTVSAAAAATATTALLLELVVELRVILALAQQPFVVVHPFRLLRHFYRCKTKKNVL